jgi:type I restriction enzyme S subunit
VIPPGWKEAHIGDVVTDLRSGLSRKLSVSDIGLPVIRSTNITDQGLLDLSDIKYWYRNDPQGASTENYFLQAGDILVNFINSVAQIGKCALYQGELGRDTIYTTNIFCVRVNDRILPEYFLLLNRTREYVHYIHSITKPAVNQASFTTKDFKRFRFALPPLSEQRKITEILGTWDKAIALTEQRIEATRQHKKGLMQRLLTGRVRFPEFVRSECRQETKFGNLSVDWKVVPLQKLVKPISRPETIQPGKEYKLIGVKLYVAGAHIHSILSGQNIKTASLSRIEENDIVYNKMWTTKAAFAVARSEHSGAYGTTEYPQFRAKENLLFVDFLEYIFHLARFQYDATALCRGTTGRARLNPRDFLRLEISLPSLEEQRRIAAVLQACDREIELLTQKRDALQRQKKGLTQRLLTGRVRVKA